MVDTEQFAVFKQGAEARLYTGTFLGREVVVKERFSKKYRHPALDTQLTRDRHRAEARALVKCRQVKIKIRSRNLFEFHSARRRPLLAPSPCRV